MVLIDIGAGTSFNSLDFFLLSDVAILAAVPEPSSIENGYRFIKSALYRRLRTATQSPVARELVDAATDPKNDLGLRTPVDLVSRVEREDLEAGAAMRREMSSFRPRFVVNEVRDEQDGSWATTWWRPAAATSACAPATPATCSEDAVWRAARERSTVHGRRAHLAGGGGLQVTRDLLKGETLGLGY